NTSKTLTVMYFGAGIGDYASANNQSTWDYNWFAEYALAVSNHEADYGDFTARTNSSSTS
ncbi:MAG TPA: hypothetical protein VGB96_12170, partial [Archangium sp.]